MRAKLNRDLNHIPKFRENRFQELASDPFYKNLMKKLKISDIELSLDFLEDQEGTTRTQFEYNLNRLFLDQPNKPRNWKIILELLMIANGAE